MLFLPKQNARDFIPYHGKDDPDPLHIPDHNDPAYDNSIHLYKKPITDHWISNDVYLRQGEKTQWIR